MHLPEVQEEIASSARCKCILPGAQARYQFLLLNATTNAAHLKNSKLKIICHMAIGKKELKFILIFGAEIYSNMYMGFFDKEYPYSNGNHLAEQRISKLTTYDEF